MRTFVLCLGTSLLTALVVLACSSTDDVGSGGATGSSGSSGSSSGSSGSSSGSSGSSSGSSGSSGQAPEPNVTLSNASMQVGGQTRTYILGVPTKYEANKPYPLVMVFHGNPGNADGMSKSLPFDGASKQDAILVYPQGNGDNWDLSTPPASNQDIAFIEVLAAEIAKKYNVDTSRVFGSGYSGGGFFLNQVACRVPNVFKAIASHAGGGPFNMNGETYPNDQCLPCSAGKVPSIHTHGKQDTEVGIDSGYYAAACWATTNGCSSTDPNDWSSVAPAPCKKAPGCDSQPVTLCWVEGLGHGQWSEAANAAWSFFTKL